MKTISNTEAIAVKAEKIDPAKKQKLQKAAKEFESMFVAYMLKTMRKSIPESGMFGDNFGGDVMESMFDIELSKQIAKTGSFGIAQSMYQKLTGEDLELARIPVKASAIHKTTRSKAVPRLQPTEQREQVQPSKKQIQKVAPVQESSLSFLQPSKSLKNRLEGFQSIIDTAAQKHGVDSTLVKAVIASESAGKINATSNKQAKGLMQLIDSTAAEMGVKNVWDPQENIQGGVKYLKQMLERFNGDISLALASYNAGPGAVQKHGGIPPYKETKEYVNKVMNYMKFFQQQELAENEK